MSRKVYVVEQRKDRSGWLVTLAAAAMIAWWKYILIAALVVTFLVAIIWLTHKMAPGLKRIPAKKRVKKQRALMDAPTQLITEGMRVWGNPEHYLDNYDDGMRGWR